MIRQPDYDRAATLAYRCLLRLGITSLPVRPLEILRKCRNTVVYTFQQAAEELGITEADFDRRCGEADAFTVRGGERYVVCYREGGNPARLNFTLAHELGHILLHHIEDTVADEAEANCFAGHLLCPQAVIEGMPPEEIATTCYVSKTAAVMIGKSRMGVVPQALLEAVEKQLANENDAKQHACHKI